MSSGKCYSFEEIAEGMLIAEEYVIDSRVYHTFLSIFPDESPVHVEEEYASMQGLTVLRAS
jgi:hypothetical protein